MLFAGAGFGAPLFTLTLLPSGAVSGSAGQTVGWGYTFDNESGFWLLITNSFFCGPGGDPNFTDCTAVPYNGVTNFGPQFGVYTDYIASNSSENLIQSGPFTTPPAAFSPGSPGTGVGQYEINLSATIGLLDTGNIFVTFDEYNGNPFDQDNPGTFVGSDETSAAASVLVTGVPEPSTFLLAGGALLALAGLRRRNAYRQ